MKARATLRDSGALNSQGLVVGEKTLPKPRYGAGNEVTSLRAFRKTPSSNGREVLSFLPLSSGERDGQGGRYEGQDDQGVAGRQGGLQGVGLEET